MIDRLMSSFVGTWPQFVRRNMYYSKELYCIPVTSMEGRSRNEVEYGGKILLPPSVLEMLSRQDSRYPMLFKIENPATGESTHCGVLEFTADEETACLPSWIMRRLRLSTGDSLTIETVFNLPVATYSRFRPLSVLFLDITDPKAVLENSLRRFACLTAGDVFTISYNNTVYELEVEETRPGRAVSIIECDMEVDFSPPEGYVEPAKARSALESTAQTKFKPFMGQGVRLDGKKQKLQAGQKLNEPAEDDEKVVGIPDYDYKVGTLNYIRDVPKPKKQPKEEFKTFSGQGRCLDDSFRPGNA